MRTDRHCVDAILTQQIGTEDIAGAVGDIRGERRTRNIADLNVRIFGPGIGIIGVILEVAQAEIATNAADHSVSVAIVEAYAVADLREAIVAVKPNETRRKHRHCAGTRAD